MFSIEKIQQLMNDPEDFLVQELILAVNLGQQETVGYIFMSIREFLEEKRQDDLLELVDFYLENYIISSN